MKKIKKTKYNWTIILIRLIYHQLFFIKGTRNFQIINDQLLYIKKHQLKVFSLRSFDEIDFSLPDSVDVKQARIEQSRLYLLHKEKMSVYELQ